MTETDTVLVERDGPVTIVSINRPHCRNAVDGATARKLFDAFMALRCRRRGIGRGVHRHRRLFLRRRRPQGGGSGRSQQEARDRRPRFDRADGAEPAAAVKARDRGGGGFCGGRRHGTGAVGGHARGRRGRHLRHLLPPLRRAADRSRHHPAAAADRSFAGDRSDPHRAPGRRPRSVADGPCQPPRARRARPARRRLRWPRRSRASRKPACAPTGCRRCGNGTEEEEAIANEMRGGLEVIASGETLSGARVLHPASAVTARSAGMACSATRAVPAIAASLMPRRGQDDRPHPAPAAAMRRGWRRRPTPRAWHNCR